MQPGSVLPGPVLPWDIVETFPSTGRDLIDRWNHEVQRAVQGGSAKAVVTSHVGCALALYWAVPKGLESDAGANIQHRRDLVGAAGDAAMTSGEPDLIATALLGRLHALWGPEEVLGRPEVLGDLDDLVPSLQDRTLALRVQQWQVLSYFDAGDLQSARAGVTSFAQEVASSGLSEFARREELWRANLAMLEGRIDEAVKVNTDAISSTSQTAGSPFSFQNVAVTVSIERYLRRQMGDVIDSIRSIRASSPRVAANWDVALAFALAESGELEAAGELFEALADESFQALPRDLNWLVTMQLVALVAVHLGDTSRSREILGMLEPYADLDATHGSGYASYGPVGRICGLLASTVGDPAAAAGYFDAVLTTREPGPWTSLTRLHRALAPEVWDTDGAPAGVSGSALERRHAELGEVDGELRSMGMDRWAESAAGARVALVRETGVVPTILYEAGELRLHGPWGSAAVSGVGATALRELLMAPGEPIAATRLEGVGPTDSDGRPVDLATASEAPVLDERARVEYRERLADLEGPDGTLSRAEIDEVSYLKRALAGSAYPIARPAEDERSRVRVTKALRRCVAEITRQCPPLGEHLGASLATGRRCSYTPADGTTWILES
ncbi:MAG: hypothetical protein ACK5O2_05745 [Microthrixaceae bacterium]